MTATTKRERRGLEFWLDKRGFTAESANPDKDGTVQIRVLRPKRGQPRAFPESFYIVPADDMGESYWADRIRDLLEIPSDQKLRIIPVASWFPRPGSEYRVRIRRGRGGLVYAFPAERQSLTDGSWRPGPVYLQAGKWRFRRGKDMPGRPVTYLAQHPETGQYVLTWGEVPIPEGAQEALVDMAGLMIRPVHTAAYWIAGKPKVVEGLTESQMILYDEDLARRIFLATTAVAPEVRILGEEWSPPEIFGTPRPIKQSDAHLLGRQFEKVLDAADAWRRRELMPAIHPDNWPLEILEQLTPEQKRQLSEIAGEIYSHLELAWDWYVDVLRRMEENIRRVLASGIPLSRQDFTLPKPEGRAQRRRPMISYSREEIRQMMLDSLTGVGKRRKAEAEERRREAEKKPVGKATPAAKPSAPATTKRRPAKKGKLAPPRQPPGRVIASVGSEAGGDTTVRAAMRRAVAQLPESETPPTTKPRKTYYFGHCPSCGRRIRTSNPELSGKVIPGTPCRKCAKNAKKKK